MNGAIGLTDELKDKILGYESVLAGENNRAFASETDFAALLSEKMADSDVGKIYDSAENLAGKAVRFNKYDIEKISMVIPEYNQVREGDILVNTGYTLSEVAIVTGVDAKKPGRSGISVVCMEEKTGGSAVLKTWSDLENPENFCARRLLKQKVNADSAFVWGKRNFRVGKSVSDSKIKDYLISVDKDKKSKIATYEYKILESGYIQIMSITEMNYAGFWRWIPNTGEYTHFWWPQVNLIGPSGVNLRFINYTAQIIAKDRNFDSTKPATDYANIYNNTQEANFTIAFREGSKTEIKNYCTLVPVIEDGNSTGEYIQKEADMNFTFTYSGHWLKSGNVYLNDLYIRPENAVNFRPGNDLILGLRLKGSREVVNGKKKEIHKYDITVYTKDENYVACYDKKALWRANLYIDEGFGDWNNKHPWDAPYCKDDNSNHSISKETAEIFGYNEWNKDFAKENDGSLKLKSNGDGVSYVPSDGRQLKGLPMTKWYYGHQLSFDETDATKYKRSVEAGQIKFNKAKVAYDYWGWDNPFSFIGKMEIEKRLLHEYYNTDRTIFFGKPAKDWPSSCSTISEYRLYLGKTIVPDNMVENEENLNMLSELFTMYKDSKNRFSGDLSNVAPNELIYLSNYGAKLKNGSTTEYEFDSAYNLKTKNYPKFFENVNKAESGMTAYIPGMSDALSFKDNTGTYYTTSAISPITAGTDCVGLVQTAIGYKDENGKSYYAGLKGGNGMYYPVPFFIGTTGNNTTSARDNLHDTKNQCLIGKHDDPSETITGEDGSDIEVYKFYENVVPGDIIYYSGHIMMVDNIEGYDGIDNNHMYWKDGSKMHIIESVYHGTDGCFGVVKTRDLKLLSDNNHQKAWKIWRQK